MRFWPFFLLLLSLPTFATVNPVDRSLLEQSTDSESFVKLTRTYHSGHAQTGLFGKGWCSLWESRLVARDGAVEFKFCGMGQSVVFTKAGQVWTSPDPLYQLTAHSNASVLTLGFRSEYRFDGQGRLRAITLGRESVQLGYDTEGKLTSLTRGKDVHRFTYVNNRLATVSSTRGEVLQYKFSGDLLSSVRLNQNQIAAYEYTAEGLLTRVTLPASERRYQYAGGRVARVEYGRCADRLTDESGGVKVETHCEGQAPSSTFFAIEGKSRATNLSVTQKSSQDFLERRWKNGQLVSERSPAGRLNYAYDTNGFVREIATPNQTLRVLERSSGEVRKLALSTAGKTNTTLVDWKDGQVNRLRQPSSALDVRVRRQPSLTEIKSKNFQLTYFAADHQNWIRGVWDKKQMPAFPLRPDLRSYSAEQLKATAALTTVLQLVDRVESL